ncbi:MAG TPA: MXAN_5187 C-terminal domain-containing protein [Candidatus Acidoferrales bacterium]|jgi:hypothetical protein|nr:MXAN_5187 C-terminal domain-containing protein [Candidatus Acidoferrales bacterium]
MASVDEDLNQLEKDVRQLKIEFDMFFGGGRKRPPQETLWRAEQMIKRYSERSADMNFSQRFRFNNLAQNFAKNNEVWRKKLKQKEEGFVQRHFGSAAKAIEKERVKSQPPAAPAATEAGRARGGSPPSLYAVACSDPDREPEKVQDLYKALVEAKKKAGEKTDALTLDSFQAFVRQKTEQLKKQKGAAEVEYAISVEEGQVKLKARVK